MKERNAVLLLLLTSFIWGLSFVAQSVSTESIGAFTFNGIRMILGAIVLIPFAAKTLKVHIKDKVYMKKMLKGGFLMGLFLGAASMTQQIGIETTDAGKAAFITSLYMIIVPFISRIFGKKIEKKIWFCAMIALIGMYMLCLSGGMSIGRGDIFLVLCAILFSCHILVIEKVSKDSDGVELSLFQFLFGGIMCSIGMLVFERPDFQSIKEASLPLAYAGFLSCGVAYTLQTVAQKYVQATKATLALSLESVWAAIGGALILSERLSVNEVIGCALVFLAVLLAQLDVHLPNTSSQSD